MANAGCDCHMRCTVQCLNACHDVAETQGIGEGHLCFNKCQYVCLTGCAVLGRPDLQGFFPTTKFVTFTPPTVIASTTTLEVSDSSMHPLSRRASALPTEDLVQIEDEVETAQDAEVAFPALPTME